VETKIYLYDASGSDEEIELENVNLAKVRNNHLLWVDVLRRDRDLVKQVIDALELKNIYLGSILNVSERPKISIFDNFYRFFIVSVKINERGTIEKVPIDYIVGKNFVVTIHEGEVDYFNEFRDREKGETQLGKLDAESFISPLLDLHIVTYFRALEKIEATVDDLDEAVLKTGIEDNLFLTETVRLRRSVSSLRRWFLPHRDVFYALSHSDFQQIVEDESLRHFEMLNVHFENAVDAIESSRDTVLSLFDLYATKTAQLMNKFVQRLTFVTLLVGGLGAIAGVWGMNFEVEYFKFAETGFWVTIGSMGFLAIGLTLVAKYKGWL
jgi:magnesium/cobalt transport protein CorA